MVKLNIQLDKKLINNLKNINDEILKKAKKIIIESALVDIESGAKNRLTVKRHVVTGRLRASIHTVYTNFNTSYIYKDDEGNSFKESLNVKPTQTRTYFDIYIGTAVRYAQKIERLDAYLYPSFKQGEKNIKKELKKIVS